MTRCLTLLASVIFFSASSWGNARQIEIPEVGATIATPEDFKYKGLDSYYYLVESPGGIMRFHWASMKAATPLEGAELSEIRRQKIKGDEEKKGAEGKQLAKTFLTLQKTEPFQTASGIVGVKATFANELSECPMLKSYYFTASNGKIACICVLRVKKSEDWDTLEKVILQSLQTIPVKKGI